MSSEANVYVRLAAHFLVEMHYRHGSRMRTQKGRQNGQPKKHTIHSNSMNSGDCLSNCPRGRGKNNKQHRKLSFSTAKKSGNCIYFWCLVPQINPGALEKTWYVFNIPIIYNTQRCIVAAARVSLFHPQTKTNYEDEFPEDELPPEDEFLFEDGFRRRITRRRTPRRRILKTNFPEYELLPEDEFWRRILKTNSPKTKIAPEDEFRAEDEWLPKTNSFPKTRPDKGV